MYIQHEFSPSQGYAPLPLSFSYRRLKKAPARRRSETGTLAEVPFSLFVLLFFAVFPLVNLTVAAGAGTIICLLTHQEASKAAVQRTFEEAQIELVNQANALLSSGFARAAKLKAVNGFQSTGANLIVEATNYFNSNTTYSQPNQAPDVVDTSTNIYEYMVQSTYDIFPFLDLSGVPGFAAIPGLGKPIRICFSAHRAVEYPQGLEPLHAAPELSGGTSPVQIDIPGVEDPGQLTNFANSGWNHPELYDLIKAAGQEVLQEEVLKVFANNSSWTGSNLTIQPGDRVWIDYRADGLWGCYHRFTDADGETDQAPAPNGFAVASMVGMMASNQETFHLGNQQWNMTPPGTGAFSLMCNDIPGQYGDNTGVMSVRVIVAR